MNEAVEKQYNPRTTITPEQLATYTELGARSSQAARERFKGVYDLRYGTGPLETADFFHCGQPNAPVMVFFHGGYWRARDKKDYSFVVNGVLPLGCSVVVMNYEGVRIFQGLYNRALAAYQGAAITDEQLAVAFEGTVVQYVNYLSARALRNSYPRLPALLQGVVNRGAPQLAAEALDEQLAAYMAAVPAAQAPRRRASAAAMQALRNGPAGAGAPPSGGRRKTRKHRSRRY